jgi:hypothetical protein
MEIKTMLKANENQDLSYVSLQLSEILFLLDHADDYGTKFVLEQVREAAQNAADRFQQPEGTIVFERVE